MRVEILLLVLAAPSRASECPAKKCANWCKSELKENRSNPSSQLKTENPN